MKKLYIKALAALLLGGSAVSCGDDFLDAKIYEGVDMDTALNSVTNIQYGLNGCYDRLYRYYFAGNFATSLGDLASDLSYWNEANNHYTALYQFAPTPTTSELLNIWNYGYKVVDNSSRVIQAGKSIAPNTSESEIDDLNMYIAEAYALRGYAEFVLVNIFGHQIKVNGVDFSSQPGIVVVENAPIGQNDQISRSTVGETYAAIIRDLQNSLDYFEKAGQDKQDKTYMSPTAVWGLLSRVYLYMEDYQASIDAADKAIQLSGISTLTYGDAAYKALYNYGPSNTESFFYLAITTIDNWSANSCGTTWSSYNYSPSPWLQSITADTDCRRAVWTWNDESTPMTPVFGGGKFAAFATGNPANGTNYLINAPEMFLNKAESYLNLSTPNIALAQDALLVVAKRNSAITSVADLPSTIDGLKSFIQDERARELFQEGLRLYDLRRWDVKANVFASEAPDVHFNITNYKISDCVFPIPDREINTGKGVTQTPNWASTFPSM